MKAVILAGGLGTRLSEETQLKPKPMVEIGQKPILWHIMKTYSAHGINEFIVCCGYKGEYIKEYFLNFSLKNSDFTLDIKDQSLTVSRKTSEEWKVHLIDTGAHTLTGGRLNRVKEYLRGDKAFCFTYGDGLTDVDITATLEFHFKHGKQATVLAVPPQPRFGLLKLSNRKVTSFNEKPVETNNLINGGYFVLSSAIFDLELTDDISWEDKPLDNLVKNGQLMAFEHYGFWQPMDTLRDKIYLNNLWENGEAPWKVW